MAISVDVAGWTRKRVYPNTADLRTLKAMADVWSTRALSIRAPASRTARARERVASWHCPHGVVARGHKQQNGHPFGWPFALRFATSAGVSLHGLRIFVVLALRTV
jgi:hypothetical protein